MEQQKFDFYNTIDLKGPDLDEAIRKAKDQQSRILVFFCNNWECDFTPTEVLNALFRSGKEVNITPLTSVRRAISNLTAAGHLVKTDTQRPGNFGKPNYTWKYNYNLKA